MNQPAALTPQEARRYSRHLRLSEFGLAGQEALKRSRVLVIGAGGLGSPVALYLAAAGVGVLGLADFDVVEEHNLQRQILHGSSDVGRPKVESGRERLRELNPYVELRLHPEGVNPDNALALFADYDLIVDGSDNFSTRYLNTDAAFFAGKPLVYGSIARFEGQVAVFHPAGGGPCYRCLFPEPPEPGSVPNCGEAGVLGAICGVVGSLQAMEAIKQLAGIGAGLTDRLLLVDALSMQVRTLRLKRDPECPLCGEKPTITGIDAGRYPIFCAAEAPVVESLGLECSVEELHARRSRGQGPWLLDVREPHERAICRIDGSVHIPMAQVPQRLDQLPRDEPLVVYCHHGARSLKVVQFLRGQGFEQAANLAGGIDAWAARVEPGMLRY